MPSIYEARRSQSPIERAAFQPAVLFSGGDPDFSQHSSDGLSGHIVPIDHHGVDRPRIFNVRERVGPIILDRRFFRARLSRRYSVDSLIVSFRQLTVAESLRSIDAGSKRRFVDSGSAAGLLDTGAAVDEGGSYDRSAH